jgi:uncharacterized membrane protein HdeD (DUF308 family)
MWLVGIHVILFGIALIVPTFRVRNMRGRGDSEAT